MDNQFIISMKLENIGPHHGENTLPFSESINSNKSVIYATNGTGKSFISRAFRLCSPSKVGLVEDKILTIGQSKGIFSFGIKTGNEEKNLKIMIQRGNAPVIDDSTGLLFHTFNSDYVEENIRPKHYSPDGKIEGYILGKAQIDLTEERRKESDLKTEIEKDSKAIDDTIAEAKAFLKNAGVGAKTTELLAITREKAEQGFEYSDTDSVEECIRKIKALEDVPEDLVDIQFPIGVFFAIPSCRFRHFYSTVFMLVRYCWFHSQVDIPETIAGKRVSVIGSYAFDETGVKDVFLSHEDIIIDDGAFDYHTGNMGSPYSV